MLKKPVGKSGVNHRLRKLCEIADLNRQLDNLIGGKGVKNIDLGITKEINEGIAAAAKLKAQLKLKRLKEVQ